MQATLEDARGILRSVFGFGDFRPAQARVVAAVLGGTDVLAVMPTGAGKSICFQVPALLLRGVTIVVSPLIALMEEQVAKLGRLGVAAVAFNSSRSPAERRAAQRSLLEGSIKLLYLSPERLVEFHERGVFQRLRVALFAVDEAHCVSLWGHDFRPSYLGLAEVIEAVRRPPVLALTATATPAVRADIAESLRLRRRVDIVTSFERPNLHLSVAHVRDERERLCRVRDALRSAAGPAIVYAPTRSSVTRLVHDLRTTGLRSAGYHAGMTVGERYEVQQRFLQNETDCLVATNAFGMGVDKGDIRLVVHCALPMSLEDYYQESGRAGRDGQPAFALLVSGPHDRGRQEQLLERGRPTAREVQFLLEWMHASSVRRGTASRLPGLQPPEIEERLLRAMAFLIRQGLVSRGSGPVHVRLTATPSRAQAIFPSLSVAAQAILQQVLDARRPGNRWQVWPLPRECRSRAESLRALRELERHSILVFDCFVQFRARASTLETAVAIASRRLAQLAEADRWRLDCLEQYAATRRCRTATVLGYFGQDAGGQSCRHCDNCERHSR
jgi:ATP-dependent DNA helicase RecQ